MQRRRRKKAAPKNIFGTGSSSSSTKPTNTNRSQVARPIRQRAPPSVPGAKPKAVAKKSEPVVEIPEKSEPVVEIPEEIPELPAEELEEEIPTPPEEVVDENASDLVEEQTIGSKGRMGIGLSKSEPESSEDDPEEDGRSLKARQIIQSSMLKASRAIEKVDSTPTETTPGTISVEPKDIKKKPQTQRKFRNKMSSYQPASRAKRLDRSRHMEYKYEMRGILVDIGVAEEHRSNLLATIWARGERQTTKEAKAFLEEKLSEGIIDEEQMNSLERIVDAYTIRR